MPRATTRPTIMLALSISATARTLSVPAHVVHHAVDEGRLELRQATPNLKRIPVSSIQNFIQSWPLTERNVPNGTTKTNEPTYTYGDPVLMAMRVAAARTSTALCRSTKRIRGNGLLRSTPAGMAGVGEDVLRRMVRTCRTIWSS